MQKNETETFYPKNQTEWRAWLQENHLSKQAVWLVFYKKKSKFESLTWSEAVDVAPKIPRIQHESPQKFGVTHVLFENKPYSMPSQALKPGGA